LARRDPTTGEPEPGYDVYVKEKAVLNLQHQRAYTALKLDPNAKVKYQEKNQQQAAARAWMCQTFFDIRMFGAVMTTEINCGQVRGPVQFAFARSVDPIASLEQSITRMAVTTEREAEQQGGDNRTMGRKEIVPYGLYIAHGFVSPNLALDTLFSPADLDLLWKALADMFDNDRSAARGEVASRKLVVFEHESLLGNAPAHALFDRLKITRKDTTKPARAYSDYEVTLDKQDLPAGITVHDML
jgi:CRISPR-associated protein Csd2